MFRRKFFDLHQAHASPIATEAVERIGQLYRIESEIAVGRRMNGSKYATSVHVLY